MGGRLFASLLLLFISFQVSVGQQQLKTEDYEKAEDMLGWKLRSTTYRMGVSPKWQTDGSFWYRVADKKGSEYVYFNPKTKEKVVSPTRGGINSLLPESPAKQSLNPGKGILSPDNKKVAFIKDWNLWIRDINSGQEKQLTSDGIKNFGYATDNAGWRKSDRPILRWSPDSKKIATFQQDQRHVSDMYMIETRVGAPALREWKYPLPEDEEVIQIHRVIINVEKGEVIRLNMNADPRRGTLCDDISCNGTFDDTVWDEQSSTLAFVSTSRDHKIAQLRVADAKSGVVTDIFKEEVATQYESGQGTINWKYLPKSKEFIWYSERDNWGHLYLYDLKTGKLKNQITKGDFVVTRVKYVDKKNRAIYFEANGREPGRDPYFSHFYKVDFSGKNLTLLTPEDGNHRISIFATECSTYICGTFYQW